MVAHMLPEDRRCQERRKGSTGVTHRALVALGLLCSPQGVAGAICRRSPNCTALRREPCNTRGLVDNVCGPCLPDAYGGSSSQNTVCLSKNACGAIHASEENCKHLPGSGKTYPFILPFGRCLCDDGTGRFWPTAPGKCAQITVIYPTGSGQYEVQMCTSTTCEPETCSPLATWEHVLDQTAENLSFPCTRKGEDSIQLLDDCEELTRRQTASALCGHAGFEAVGTVFDSLGTYPLDCELAPRCPASVLPSRLQESCCEGNLWSRQMVEAGEAAEVAPGFCRMVRPAVEVDDGNGSNGSNTTTPEPYSCLVRTNNPGWTGCACVDEYGQTQVGQTCTLTCEEPGCRLPAEGIPPVPTAWQSTEVIPQLFPDLTVMSFGIRSSLPLGAWICGFAALLRR
mmetsp:Transcript_92985/g.165358  ORF Transcript_92985/g.165358 Transcript_92985/m.165358 type:complete len:398 (-) Transcript_92985:194-1387(-)